MSETFWIALWTVLGLIAAFAIAFWLLSTAMRWREQRNDAWDEWKDLLSIINRTNHGAFDNGVVSPDGQDEGETVTWGHILDSRFRYERVSSKKFFFRSRATTSRFEEKEV